MQTRKPNTAFTFKGIRETLYQIYLTKIIANRTLNMHREYE